MRVAIVLRALSSIELSEVSTSYDIVYYDTSNTAIDVSSIGRDKIKDIPLGEQAVGLALKNALTEIVEFAHVKLGEHTVAEHLSFNGSTYWYYIKHKIFNQCRNLVPDFEKVKSVLESIPVADNIDLYGDKPKVLDLLGNPDNVKIKLPEQNTGTQRSGKLYYLAAFLFRAYIGWFQMLLLFGKKRVLFTSPHNKQPIVDLETLELKQGDILIEYLQEYASKDKEFLFLSEYQQPGVNSKAKRGLSRIIDVRYWQKTLHIEVLMLLTLANPINIWRVYKFRKVLKQQLSSLRKLSSNSANKFKVNMVAQSANTMLMAYFKELVGNTLFSIKGLSCIGGEDEHTLRNNPILNSAQRKGIKTFGIQHGGISAANIVYTFNKDDERYNPYPSYTIVRGQSTFNQLTQGSTYPTKGLKILGHSRTDCIPRLKNLKVEDVVEGFKGDKALVFFATQPFKLFGHELVTRNQLAEDFFEVCKNQSGINFIIKPHPNQRDLSYYQSFIDEFNLSNVKIIRSDLYRVLAVSDIVITSFSTVGIEAIYFDKELVTLDYLNEDRQGYIQNEVGFNATDAASLERTINQILKSELKAKPEAKEAFIKERAYKIDGQRSKAYYQFIKSI